MLKLYRAMSAAVSTFILCGKYKSLFSKECMKQLPNGCMLVHVLIYHQKERNCIGHAISLKRISYTITEFNPFS